MGSGQNAATVSLDVLTDMLLGQDILEWLGLITGILYVVGAAYERPVAWIFGMMSSACLAWKSFHDYKLIADGLLQLFYIGMSVVGLLQWQAGRSAGTPKPIRTFTLDLHVAGIAICMLVSWPVSELLIRYFGARYGYPDTALLMVSLWATGLLIKKDLHQWVYWIFIDVFYVWLYWRSEAYLFAVLFFVYGVIAVWGWRRWSSRYRMQARQPVNP